MALTVMNAYVLKHAKHVYCYIGCSKGLEIFVNFLSWIPDVAVGQKLAARYHEKRAVPKKVKKKGKSGA